MNRLCTRAVFLIASLALTAIAAGAALANALPRGFTEQYIHTLKQVIEADGQAYEQMTVVAKRLEMFYMRFGHFPDSDEERDAFREWVSKYISYNPYQPEIIDHIEHKRVATPYVVPLIWRKNEGLEAEDFKALLEKPDPSWKADPGTIYVLTNGRNIFLIWAASADRLPLRHLTDENQKPRMICREIVRE